MPCTIIPLFAGQWDGNQLTLKATQTATIKSLSHVPVWSADFAQTLDASLRTHGAKKVHDHLTGRSHDNPVRRWTLAKISQRAPAINKLLRVSVNVDF